MTTNQGLLKWHCRPGLERPLRYANRLIAMEPEEIIGRLGGRALGGSSSVAPPWEPPEREALRVELESRFLFGPDRARRLAQCWRQSCPEQADRLVASASRGLESWEIFGVSTLLQPGRVDWHSGPPTAPTDIRWVWELNRHQYLFTLARAFQLTGDVSYPQRIAELVEDWCWKNPPHRGVNWSSALEVGVRAISWLWTLPLLLDWRGLKRAFLRDWLASLLDHYQYLRGRLSLYTDPTNHLIGEAAALWMLSVALPRLPDAEREEQRALNVLSAEIARQVSPDGVDREHSTDYQRFVLDFYLQVMALARRVNRALPPVIRQRVAGMLDFLETLGGPDGQVPAIGDSDDARGLPFPGLSNWSWRLPEVSIWLWGPDGLPPELSSGGGRESRIFPQGGYCLLQAAQQGQRMALLFDFGPLGLWPNASHGHADALSIQVRLGGCWLVADPGTGAYSSCLPIRDLLRGTGAHNTVTIDGLDQSDPLDVFKWLKPVPASLLDFFSDQNFEFALASHEGYRRLRQPATHFRAVLFVRPPAPHPLWLVADRIEGEGRHHCALRFHFPPGTELHADHPQAVRVLDSASGAGLRLVFSDAVAGRGPVYQIDSAGLWSRRFGQWEPAPVLVVERTAALPLSWFTYLLPSEGPSESESVEAVTQGSSAFCRRLSRGLEERIEWTIEGASHRFSFRRFGEFPLRFKR